MQHGIPQVQVPGQVPGVRFFLLPSSSQGDVAMKYEETWEWFLCQSPRLLTHGYSQKMLWKHPASQGQ